MKSTMKTKPVILAAMLSFGLVACGDESTPDAGVDDASNGAASTGESGSSLTLADNGPDFCFKAAAEERGADTKIATLSSTFGVGENLEQYVVVSTPVGEVKTCTLDYQNPEDPNKLLRVSMDTATGEFKEPEPVEITVMGNASEFSLDNIVVALSDIKTSSLAASIDGAKAKLDETFSSHALSSVRVLGLNPGRANHIISVDFDGRLKSNDVLDSGSLGIKTDGTLDYNNIGK